VHVPSPAEAMSSPTSIISPMHKSMKEHTNVPLGENRTTLTGAECRLSVERYSIRGGRGATGFGSSLTSDTGRMFGYTIHTYT